MSARAQFAERPWVSYLAFGAACALFLVSLFGRLGTPLMWNDEAETAMYATRVLEYGYPKVHDGKNNLYVYDDPSRLSAYDARTDAYVNSGWAQFYAAAPAAWVAQHFSDPHVRTAILRFPFALAGTIGVALLALALVQFFRRRLLVAGTFVVLCSLCIPLTLHLREVRYYAFALFLLSAVIWLFLQYDVRKRLRYQWYVLAMALLLVLVFLTFHPLFYALVATLGLAALWRAGRNWRQLLRFNAPLGLAVVAVVPFALYFRTFALSHELNDRFGFVLADYVQNAGTIIIDLSTNSLFIPVVVVCTLVLLAYKQATAELRSRVAANVQTLAFLGALSAATVAIISGSVILHQRYYFFLMPILVLMFVLGIATCHTLLDVQTGTQRAQDMKRWMLRVLAVTIAIPIVLSAKSIAGHGREIVTPYMGTVDYVVHYIREQYVDPTKLVIATNYEEHAYMYYLGSRVTIGQTLNNLPEDLAYQPDIIIPRQLWKFAAYPYFDTFRKSASYREVTFPIADFFVNNIPELRHPRFYHQFVSRPVGDGEPMRIYVRTTSQGAP